MKRILIIRFSSIGDIVQTLSAATRLSELDGEIHWLTRQDMAELVEGHPHVNRLWKLDRKKGLPGLLAIIKELKAQKFTHIFDAHNNLRSRVIVFFLTWPMAAAAWMNPIEVLRRPHLRLNMFLTKKFRHRKTFLFYSWLQKYFLDPKKKAQQYVLESLKLWGLGSSPPSPPQFRITENSEQNARRFLEQNSVRGKFVVLCPSAAHPVKIWPQAHWQKLIDLLPTIKFVILAGPKDSWVKDFRGNFSGQIIHSATALSLKDCAAVIRQAAVTVGNDSGLIHITDQIGAKGICLLGPTFFGRPSNHEIIVVETELSCRPCTSYGKDKCTNSVYQKCMVDLSPQTVAKHCESFLS